MILIGIISLLIILFPAEILADDITVEAMNRGWIIAISLIMVIGCLIMDYFIYGAIKKEFSMAVEYIEQMAEGDLSKEFSRESSDEIKPITDALQRLGSNFQKTVKELKSGYGRIYSESRVISSAAQKLYKDAAEQANAVQDILLFMEQIGTGLQQIADNAFQVEGAAVKASQDAEVSKSAYTKVVDAMKQIADKTSLIQDIARQTNMLALNINIRAVNSNQQEKGFVGVAWEVGKLAIKTKKAAADITKQAISSIKIAQTAGEKIKLLVPVIQQTEDLAREMNIVNNEKYLKLGQLHNAWKKFDEVILRNANNAEEINTRSQQLLSHLMKMKQNIDFFKVGGEFSDIENREEIQIEESVHFDKKKEISQ